MYMILTLLLEVFKCLVLLLKRFPDSSISSLIWAGWCEEGHPTTNNWLMAIFPLVVELNLVKCCQRFGCLPRGKRPIVAECGRKQCFKNKGWWWWWYLTCLQCVLLSRILFQSSKRSNAEVHQYGCSRTTNGSCLSLPKTFLKQTKIARYMTGPINQYLLINWLICKISIINIFISMFQHMLESCCCHFDLRLHS